MNHIIMLQKDIGEIIIERRKELRINQSHLSEVCEISKNTLYKIERGQANPSLKILTKILDVLGLEVSIKTKDI